MKDFDAMEQAYENGYEKAKQEVAGEIFYLIDNYIEIVKTTVDFDLDFLIKSIKELEKQYIGEKK